MNKKYNFDPTGSKSDQIKKFQIPIHQSNESDFGSMHTHTLNFKTKAINSKLKQISLITLSSPHLQESYSLLSIKLLPTHTLLTFFFLGGYFSLHFSVFLFTISLIILSLSLKISNFVVSLPLLAAKLRNYGLQRGNLTLPI